MMEKLDADGVDFQMETEVETVVQEGIIPRVVETIRRTQVDEEMF